MAENVDPKFVKDVDLANIPVTKTTPLYPRYSTGFFGYAATNDHLVADGFPDVHLQPSSPCLASGFNGNDMGAYVPEQATISGVPPTPTVLTEATIPVAGLDINGYKFRVLGPGFDGTWSAERQDWKVVNSITVTGTTAKATTATPHGFANGDVIEVEGADTDRTGYNGKFPVSAVTDTTFSYAVPAGLPSPATPNDLWCRRPEPIHLTGLADGDYRVEVVRKNVIGVWQDEGDPTIGTWTVASGPQPPPAISSLDPAAARPGDEVLVSGADFHAGITVSFRGTSSPSVTLVASGSLKAVVPVIPVGPAVVLARNLDGKSSAPVDFTVLEPPLFIRGDANLDGSVDIVDPIVILFHLFGNLPVKCVEATDSNSDGKVSITDAIFLLEFLFRAGSSPAAPNPDPGEYTRGAAGLGCREGLPRP